MNCDSPNDQNFTDFNGGERSFKFSLSIFSSSELGIKNYFAARDTAETLVGVLVASPIPAREGWYLEDFLHAPDSPRGTTDLLVIDLPLYPPLLDGLVSRSSGLSTLSPSAEFVGEEFSNHQL